MAPSEKLTPMFRQYRALKESQPDAILLFRMGDFYEMFYDDAKTASVVLELTLTARGKGTANVVPMCGFPHHQLDGYTAKLVAARHKVAICDQVEDPKQAKGLVRREIVRIVTPGTITDPDQLEAKAHAWIAGLAEIESRPAAAFLDASTGDLFAYAPPDGHDDPWGAVLGELRAFAPREIVFPEGRGALRARLEGLPEALISEGDPFAFSLDDATDSLNRQLGTRSLDGFGLRDRPAAVAACGGVLHYVRETQRSGLEHVDRVRLHEPANRLVLDPATRRNLELDRSIRDGTRRGSLFDDLDLSVTPGGGRLLRGWLSAPLLDPAEIGARLDAVEELVGDEVRRSTLREALCGVRDIERLLARTVAGTATPRDLAGLGASLSRVPDVEAGLARSDASLLARTFEDVDPCGDVAQRLAGGLVDSPPATLKDGGVIRDGFHPELDELRSLRTDGRSYIASLERAEREATGIASLKVRFNKVFGYFIEVSKSNLKLVPEHYVRKQTIAGGERYITPELKEHEARVLHAQERIEALEAELFVALRTEVASHGPRIKALARRVSRIDVLTALAELAATRGYSRPAVDDGGLLQIDGGRHPVVERTLGPGRFVPNATKLDRGGRAIAILTGPNMGGKSTYLRQVALIVLLAQSGSFVPARHAHVGAVDRIFCRVGASDSLVEGQSTFMVEMTETANILHHASRASLVLLDEIGRGTSTFDGLSIAWAVVEHLAALAGGAPRTLFATHYHELTELAVESPSVTNLRMAVAETGGEVSFLHTVEEGASDRSYGIHVARLAGIPMAVVERARAILRNLERDEYGADGLPRRARRRLADTQQLALFAAPDPPAEPAAAPAKVAEVISALRGLEPERMTPLEALNRLAELRDKL